jgi:NAD(P)-dependent dehydrogenase (short-subunit alcohol dehydrogenase family)
MGEGGLAASLPSGTGRPERVWFVTGCSSGLGRALCEHVLALGEKAVCTARNPDTLHDLVRRFPDKAIGLALDVTKQASIDAAVSQAIERCGRIDVLVNNAGYGVIGALEEVDEAEVLRVFDTNTFGVYRVTRAIVPHMRRQRSGHILNVSSALGVVAKAGYTFYSATKFAVEGLSEALAQEMAPFGIKVTIVEPGSFRTEFRRAGAYEAPMLPAYAESLGPFRRSLAETDGKQPGDPQRGARAIVAAVNAANPPLRLALGEACVAGIEKKLTSMREELDEWMDVSLSTSFADARR